jgi:predicted AlkP superfamily phosphohydrolase/phosphomutase
LQEIDVVQHFLMGFYEEGHEWYDEEMAEYVFENFYGRVDEKLGELLEDLGEDSMTLVISDHGFQTSDRTVYLGNFLAEEGFAVPNRTGDLTRRAINVLKSLDVFGLRRHVPHAKKIRKDKESMVFDWERSDAICLGGGYVPTAPIYVTAEGERRDHIIERLEDRFRAFRDPKTGERIVSDVLRGSDVYDGDQIDLMPDLLVSSETHAFRTALHPEKPTVVDMLEFTNRPGIHAQDGVLLASGSGVRSGGVEVNGRLRDLAPTILYYLGESVPTFMDGSVLSDLFTDEFNEDREATRVDIPSDRDDFGFYSAEEEEQMKETLSKLGYVD